MKPEHQLKKIGQKLRETRIKSGYSAYDKFAFTFDLDAHTVFRAENGENINMITFLKIIEALNISLSDFFSDL